MSLPVQLILAVSTPAAGGDGEAGGGGMFNLIFMALAMYLVFWFLIFRPQRKQQAEQQRLVNELKKGDRVQTSSGIIGTIHKVEKENDQVVLLVDASQNVKLTMVRSSVTTVIRDDAGANDKNNTKNETVESAN